MEGAKDNPQVNVEYKKPDVAAVLENKQMLKEFGNTPFDEKNIDKQYDDLTGVY